MKRETHYNLYHSLHGTYMSVNLGVCEFVSLAHFWFVAYLPRIIPLLRIYKDVVHKALEFTKYNYFCFEA